jgi:hypothetical protein
MGDRPLKLDPKDLPNNGILAQLAEAGAPQTTAKAQAQIIRRCAQDFAKLAGSAPHHHDSASLACRFVVRGVLCAASQGGVPSAAALSATAYMLTMLSPLNGVRQAINEEIGAFVTTRVTACGGTAAEIDSVAAVLSVPEMTRGLVPQHVPVVAEYLAVQMMPPGPSEPVGPREPSANALKTFVVLTSRLSANLAACSARWAAPATRAALSVIAQRRLSKEFLNAAGIVLAAVAVSRALAVAPASQPHPDDFVASTILSDLLSISPPPPKSVIFETDQDVAAYAATGKLGQISVLSGLVHSKFVAEMCPALLTQRSTLYDGFLLTTVASCETTTEQFPLFNSLKTLHTILLVLRDSADILGIPSEEILALLFTRVTGLLWKHQSSNVDAIQTQVIEIFSVTLEIHAKLSPGNTEHIDRLVRRLLS